MQKYLAEFIGTFFLVLTIGCTVIGHGAGPFAPLAIGSALMVMIFAGGHISGGHFNPAVTLGGLAAREVRDQRCRAIHDFSDHGSGVGSLGRQVPQGRGRVAPLQPATVPAFLAEFLFTFALVYVVLNVATVNGTSGNSFYGLAIGFTVLVGAFSVGNISGGAFNPAVATGISVMGLSSWQKIWIYLVAEFAGAAVAAGAFKVVDPPELEDVPQLQARDHPREQRKAA